MKKFYFPKQKKKIGEKITAFTFKKISLIEQSGIFIFAFAFNLLQYSISCNFKKIHYTHVRMTVKKANNIPALR